MGEVRLTNASQKRAVKNYRRRLSRRGMARFEVLGLDRDRALIRSLARRLAEDNAEARRIRSVMGRTIARVPTKKGGIVAALLRSPLVGAELTLTRPRTHGRDVSV